jgi:Peptidase S46
MRHPHRRTAAAAIALAAASLAHADEGMWTFDNPPTDAVKQRYGVTLDPAMLQHLQTAAVHLGASASFVSERGLVLTNHHVALNCIDQLSTPQRDLAAQGYTAHRPADELRCPNDLARVLLSTQDVTAAVQQAMAGAGSDEHRNALRKAAIAKLESGCTPAGAAPVKGASHERCEVVSLYNGSLYHLYRYRQWDDVRLVFAPELQAGFYGGDPDNFVYPRYALDVALMRVYENGRPLRPTAHLKLARKPLAEGDLVLVAGHPGKTDRLQTLAQLKATRDVQLPLQLASAEAQQALLHAYSARSPEAARQALDRLWGTENWLKAMRGEHAALMDPALIAAKEADEARFRTAWAERRLPGDPWAQVEAATARQVTRAKELWAVGYGHRTLLDVAGKLVEMANERRLPEDQRLAAYRDAALPELERKLKAGTPYYKDLEVARTAGQWQEAQSLLGAEHPFVRAVLAGATPEAAAERWLRTSRVDDPDVRASLISGGLAAIEASTDPLIQLARTLYPLKRELGKYREERIDTPIEQAADQLGRARFTLYGRALPPDATGTLRLSYGKVAGYTAHGQATPWKTTFGGLLARADAFDGKPPFNLPASFTRARAKIDPKRPLNLVTTADIIGGNSGSPLLNAQGEWVGVMFDSNLEALGGRFVYTDTQARSLAVHADAILHVLDTVYGAPHLARELRNGR